MLNKNEDNNDPVIPGSSPYSIIEINKGKYYKDNQDTWIHPKLAIQLAQWISPEFALQVSDWILDLFTFGKVDINLNKEIKLKNQQIQLLQNQFIKKQHIHEYPTKNVIYMLSTEDNKKKRIYIIGKTINLKNRLCIIKQLNMKLFILRNAV